MNATKWKLDIKAGLYELEMLFDSVGDAIEYIELTAIHSLANDIVYTLREVKEGYF